MSSTIAMIAARGGSKGIVDKNIRDFCGKPLLAWTILQALEVNEIQDVWVSSDSEKILQIATKYGAKTIRRPDALSTDTCSSESAWIHTLEHIQKLQSVDICVALQATSPLREAQDIQHGLDTFRKEQYDSLFSAGELEDFLIWRKESRRLTSLNYDYHNRGRRQDRALEYVENGSFFIFKPHILLSGNRLGGHIGVSIMDFWKSFQIDSMSEMELCAALFQHYMQDKHIA